jgi:hypothetical protein
MRVVRFGLPTKKLKLGTIELETYVLDDYIRVVEKNKLEKALGKEGKSEQWLLDFFVSIKNYVVLSDEFVETLTYPIAFTHTNDDGKQKSYLGYNALFFIEIITTIAKAKNAGYLSLNQLKTGKVADKIIAYLENRFIKNLIDEATGFSFYKENAKEKFKDFFVKHKSETAFEWITTFTDAFYEDVFTFLDTSWVDLRNNPAKIAEFIHSTIFLRIDEKTLDVLRKTKPKRNYLNTFGIPINRENPKLKEFNSNIQSFFKEAIYNRTFFMELLIKTYPKNPERGAIIFTIEIQNQKLSSFDEKLKTGLLKKM